jgi:hypothetical protein
MAPSRRDCYGVSGMPTVHVFVSTHRFSSFAAMRAFVDPTFDDDGDMLASAFCREVGLHDYEPACIETVRVATPSSLVVLLQGVSYGAQWLHLLDADIVANEAVCVYEPNRPVRPSGSSMHYCGAYDYRDDT